MTAKEAIKLLANATYSDEWQGSEELTRALHMALEALVKQIPRKPHKNRSEYFCPNCAVEDEKTCVGKNHAQGNKTRHDYCMRCGQAIDWSEDESEAERGGTE